MNGATSDGLSRMDASRSRCVRVMVVLTDAPFREKPPQLSRMDALGARSEMNAPLRDNRGGFSRKGVLSRLWYQPFRNLFCFSPFFFKHCNKIIERYIQGKLLKGKFENYAFKRK